MVDDMGIFRTTIRVASIAQMNQPRELVDVMVDTGAEFSWIPRSLLEVLGVTPERVERFETADGHIIEREVGHVFIYAASRRTPTLVVFAGAGDKVLLGAHALEGLNVRVDLVRRELVPAGPVIAAAA